MMVKLDFRPFLLGLMSPEKKNFQKAKPTTRLYVKTKTHSGCTEFTRSVQYSLYVDTLPD